MSILIKIIVGLVLLSLIVLIHEFGHFIAAKACGVVVEEFALGMGPKLFSFEKGGTVYAVRAFPIGGMCAMKGEDEEDHSEGSFQSAAVWKRIIIVAAGPVFNFVLGFIGAVVIISSAGVDPAYVAEVAEGSPAAEAGLLEGDLIKNYNGHSIANGREIYMYNQLDGVPTDTVTLTVERDGETLYFSYAPETTSKYKVGYYYSPGSETAEITGITFGSPAYKAGLKAGDVIIAVDGTEITTMDSLEEYWEENPMGDESIRLTIERDGKEYNADLTPTFTTTATLGFSYNLTRENVGVLQTISYSFGEIKYWINLTFKSLWCLVTGQVSVRDMSGPVGIIETVGDVYEEAAAYGAYEAFLEMLNMMILITVNLGIMNLLPFPALDGGRILFLIIECIRRKPVSQRIEGTYHMVGFVLLMGLMVLVTVNDVARLL